MLRRWDWIFPPRRRGRRNWSTSSACQTLRRTKLTRRELWEIFARWAELIALCYCYVIIEYCKYIVLLYRFCIGLCSV